MEEENISTDIPEDSMEETIRKTLEDIESRDDQPRDDSGKFSAKEEPTPTEAVEPTEPAEPVEPTVDEAVEKVTVPPELQKLGLRKEEAEAISKDPVAMQAFMRRSEEMHKGLEQYRAKAQFGDSMERVITPYLNNIRQTGLNPDVVINNLLNADNVLRNGNAQQKTAFMANLAREYGIDINQTNEYINNQPYVDPQVSVLQNQLQQMQGWVQQQNQAREWQERETLNSEINSFASKPENVYFEDVRSDMAGLLQAGLAPDLNTAYEMAIYANPNVRAKVLAQQQAKADQERQAVAASKAKAAKAAASVNVVRKGVVGSAKAVGTMEDTIRAKAQELGLI